MTETNETAGEGAPELHKAIEHDLPSCLAAQVMSLPWASGGDENEHCHRHGQLQDLFSSTLTARAPAPVGLEELREALASLNEIRGLFAKGEVGFPDVCVARIHLENLALPFICALLSAPSLPASLKAGEPDAERLQRLKCAWASHHPLTEPDHSWVLLMAAKGLATPPRPAAADGLREDVVEAAAKAACAVDPTVTQWDEFGDILPDGTVLVSPEVGRDWWRNNARAALACTITPQDTTSVKCAARQQGTAGGNEPTDCDWPVCGCDPHATKVIEALEESGQLRSTPALAPAGEPVIGWERSIRAVCDTNGRRWRLIGTNFDMQPIGRITADEAKALCQQIEAFFSRCPTPEQAGTLGERLIAEFERLSIEAEKEGDECFKRKEFIQKAICAGSGIAYRDAKMIVKDAIATPSPAASADHEGSV